LFFENKVLLLCISARRLARNAPVRPARSPLSIRAAAEYDVRQEVDTIAKDKDKRKLSGPGRVRTWFSDRGDDLYDFATDPYLSERLLAPFNALLNLCVDAAERRRAASAAGKAARAASKAARAKAAEEKAALRARKAEERSRRSARRKAAAKGLFARSKVRVAIPIAAVLLIVLAAAVNIMLLMPSGPKAPEPGENIIAAEHEDAPHGIVANSIAQTLSPGSTVEDSFMASDDDDELSGDAAAASESDLPDDITEMHIKERNGTITTLDRFRHHDNHSGITPKRMIDVSSNQGDIDWKKVAASDVDAVMIRVGYRGRMNGELYEDPCYAYNISEAYRYGIPFGVYIYSQAITPEEAREEAGFLTERIKGYELALPVTMDFEHESKSVYGKPGGRLYAAKLSRSEATEVVSAFCRTVNAQGYEPMIYANRDMLSRGLRADELSGQCRIWIACYGKETKYDGEYTAWQYTDRGRVDGINSYVCLDFWYGEV